MCSLPVQGTSRAHLVAQAHEHGERCGAGCPVSGQGHGRLELARAAGPGHTRHTDELGERDKIEGGEGREREKETEENVKHVRRRKQAEYSKICLSLAETRTAGSAFPRHAQISPSLNHAHGQTQSLPLSLTHADTHTITPSLCHTLTHLFVSDRLPATTIGHLSTLA